LRVGDQGREALLRVAGHGTGLLPPEATGLTIIEGKPNAATSLANARSLFDAMSTGALPPHASLPTGSRMRLGINPLFVGRGEELLRVAAALKGGEATVALGQVVASTGLGGLGKTQLAAEFVHRYGSFFAGGVFWLSFANAEDIPLQIAGCAGPAFEARSMDERLELVKSAWRSSLPRLLVFDNCEEETLVEVWRPTSGGCRVLVTSRRSYWSPTLGVTALPLDLLPRHHSIELLRRYRPDLAADDPGLDEIAEELGDLPLALHLAGSYLRAYGAEVILDGYLAELRQSHIVKHASLLGAGLDDSPSPTHHVQSVAQTFALCLSRLDRTREVDRVAIALLARMACMAPGEPVPRDLVARTLDDVDPILRADGLRRLGAIGLVEEGDRWLRLHRLLADFVRQEGMDPDAQSAAERVLIDCGRAAEQGHLSGASLAAVIPHLLNSAGARIRDGEQERTAALCTAAGSALQRAADLDGARPWYERAVAIHESVLGPDHPGTANSLTNLAGLFKAQGKLVAARTLVERALAISERTLGPEHPDTAANLNGLAGLLRDQGELAAAKSMYRRALAIRERALTPDHPNTALSLNDLGNLLHAQGELAAARPLFERALAIWERALGPDHPYTAASLNNLAALLKHQGELAAARPLAERALAVWERVLGPDHPHTAASLNNLAALLKDQGDPAAARPLLERALAIRERVLGPDHPDTVATRRAMADLAAEGGG
jgi:tetratricopeptide (TPR) repeat protein